MRPIKTIKITPGTKRGYVTLELYRELASILAMAQGKRNKDGTPMSRIQSLGGCGGSI
jgi:hypothetical protein